MELVYKHEHALFVISIVIGAMEYEDGSLGWDCTGGTVEAKYRPMQCRPAP